MHSHRSGSRLLLLLSSSSLRSPRSALFVFRGRIYNSEKYCMAAVRRRGGRVWTPPQITNKEHRTTLRISLQKIVPHRARASLRLLQRPCGSAPSFQRAPPPLLQQQMRSKGLGGRSEDSLALGKKKGKPGKKKKRV